MSAVNVINPRETKEAVEQRRAMGQRLRDRREYLNIPRQEMGELVGVTESAYGHYETGFAEMVPSKLAKAAERLGVSVAYLFGEEDPDSYDQEDRDTIRYLHNMPPALRTGARAAVRAMHDANERQETTHGKKAE